MKVYTHISAGRCWCDDTSYWKCGLKMFYLIFYLAVSLVHLLIFMNTTFSAGLFYFKKVVPWLQSACMMYLQTKYFFSGGGVLLSVGKKKEGFFLFFLRHYLHLLRLLPHWYYFVTSQQQQPARTFLGTTTILIIFFILYNNQKTKLNKNWHNTALHCFSVNPSYYSQQTLSWGW